MGINIFVKAQLIFFLLKINNHNCIDQHINQLYFSLHAHI